VSEKKVDFKLTREGFVKIEHKDAGKAEVLPESVPAWLDGGWTIAEPSTTEESTLVVSIDTEKNTGTITPVKEK
jgi:hypothetical protein